MKQNTLSKIKYFAGIKITLVILFVVTGVPSSYSQFYNGSQLSFGKNRVQYHDFFWTYYRFEKFDTYFYLNGRPLANYTAGYTKKYLKEIEENLEYTLDEKIQFIIFNKLSDLRETNIGLISDEQYNIGGITHIMGTKVFLYFNGDHRDFERQIRRGITNVIINEMMYGSSIASKIKNSTILSLPEWYTKGFISFFAEEWSIEIDNKVRDGVLSGKYEKFNRLTGEEAIYAGHSIWKFIAEKYGKSVLPNIIYMTKISRNVESGFLFVLGVSYNTLVQEWQDHYNYRYLLNNEDRDYPATESLLKKNRSEVIPCRLKVCPDGKHIAYTTNELGQYKVWLYDLETKKRKKLLKSGYKLNEKTDYSYPLLAWHPTGRVLSIIIESKDQLILYYYTVEDKKFDKYILQHFEKILDFSYSQDGKFFVFRLYKKGNRIFLFIILLHILLNKLPRMFMMT